MRNEQHHTRNFFRWPKTEVDAFDRTLHEAIAASPGLQPLLGMYRTPNARPSHVSKGNRPFALGLRDRCGMNSVVAWSQGLDTADCRERERERENAEKQEEEPGE